MSINLYESDSTPEQGQLFLVAFEISIPAISNKVYDVTLLVRSVLKVSPLKIIKTIDGNKSKVDCEDELQIFSGENIIRADTKSTCLIRFCSLKRIDFESQKYYTNKLYVYMFDDYLTNDYKIFYSNTIRSIKPKNELTKGPTHEKSQKNIKNDEPIRDLKIHDIIIWYHYFILFQYDGVFLFELSEFLKTQKDYITLSYTSSYKTNDSINNFDCKRIDLKSLTCSYIGLTTRPTTRKHRKDDHQSEKKLGTYVIQFVL